MNYVIYFLLASTILLAPVNKFFVYIGFRIHYHEILATLMIPILLYSVKNYHVNNSSLRTYIYFQWLYLVPVLLSLLSFIYIDKTELEYYYFLKAFSILLVTNTFLTLVVIHFTQTNSTVPLALAKFFTLAVFISSVYGLVTILVYMRSGVDLDHLISRALPLAGSEVDLTVSAMGSFFRLSGFTSDPSVQASFSIMVLTLLSHIIFNEGRLWHFGYFAVIFLSAILTMSGSGLVGLLASFIVIAPISVRKLGMRNLLRSVIVVALLLSPIFLLLTYFGEETLFFLRHKFAPGGTTEVHADIAHRALSIGLDYPLFGVGYNNFAYLYDRYYGMDNYNAHNSWLNYFVELGAVGLGFRMLYTAAIMLLAYRSRSSFKWHFIGGFAGMNIASVGYETLNLFFNQLMIAVLCASLVIPDNTSLRRRDDQNVLLGR